LAGIIPVKFGQNKKVKESLSVMAMELLGSPSAHPVNSNTLSDKLSPYSLVTGH